MQCKDNDANICWYVGFAYKKEPYILNFTIGKHSLTIEFRYAKYIPQEIADTLEWQNRGCDWKRISYNKYTKEQLLEIIKDYIQNLKDDFDNGKLKRHGKSYPEDVIYDILKRLYPYANIRKNHRPKWLNKKELDIYIEELPNGAHKLAIEIQGILHYKPIYGPEKLYEIQQRDAIKKDICARRGILLIWMDVKTIQIILKKSEKEQIEYITALIDRFIQSKDIFMEWNAL